MPRLLRRATVSMPAQKPGRSKQDYETPGDLLDAIEARWGKLEIDLAAREDNKKAPLCITPEQDSLATPWPLDKLCWLNPPFADIEPWAAKCTSSGSRVIMLTPASVGSNWYAKHVHDKARVVFFGPRITFVGADDPYPKDCMLTLWGLNAPGYEIWRWKK